MSRCFPFPPPGYEKKARTNDVDLLNKEKQKEKSHKEKKRDKDKEEKKREKKEKKAKDRSDGKQKDKDKKDKKEKDKDKKKENGRDKEKEKDRSNNSEEKKFSGHSDVQNGEKISDEKKLPGKSEGHSAEKFIQKEKVRDKDRSSLSGEKKLAGHISGYNGEKIGQNCHLAEDFRDSKFVQELAGRVRDEGAGARSELVDKFTGSDRKKDEGMVSFVAKTANKLAEEKEKTKKSDDRKFNVQGIEEETRAGGNAMVSNLSAANKARVEGIPNQVENNAERRGEGKEKTKEKGDDKIRDKRRDKHREKKSHRKAKDRDKAKEEKAKAKGEHRNLELDNLKGSNRDDPLNTIRLHPSKEGNKDAIAEENLRKRKDLEKNGFFHVDDVRPNKLPKISSSQMLTGNGKTLESCQAPIPLTLDSKGPGTSPRVENKERKVNGIVEAQLSSVSPAKHLSSSAQASQIDVVSTKPPHPDSKYLSQVLTVPKMEEWSDFDEQSWLFQNTESQSKKPKVGFSQIDEPPQVWAEALQIDSVDVYALPYVIPY
ncbi:protein ELC [Hibiscus syriacus]|uniref:Protein ELC n=1 Tax=Hibiscus syriacus TaxID=106335 RepID=A0A6A3B5Q0_HIBSY|nr:nipped-B-like protein B [Hibiscus syriacus]XP_038991794.1 nipped-B-like protein B [Hibiscus syriacus]KAE8712270.1 protein ELC [Hibiscus syriacus]